MPARADIFDIGQLGLSPGEASSLDLTVALDPLQFGGQTYAAGGAVETRLDVSHMTSGYALRLRFGVTLDGPCMRCLENAGADLEIDAREVDQPGGGEDLRSPYLDGAELDVRSWARDALVLALPTQIVCREDCAGLCPQCGVNLNENPDHAHEAEPDPRWAKLRELDLGEG